MALKILPCIIDDEYFESFLTHAEIYDLSYQRADHYLLNIVFAAHEYLRANSEKSLSEIFSALLERHENAKEKNVKKIKKGKKGKKVKKEKKKKSQK